MLSSILTENFMAILILKGIVLLLIVQRNDVVFFRSLYQVNRAYKRVFGINGLRIH